MVLLFAVLLLPIVEAQPYFYEVQVGYADNLRSSPYFPTPFAVSSCFIKKIIHIRNRAEPYCVANKRGIKLK